jgi:hypothetical protein
MTDCSNYTGIFTDFKKAYDSVRREVLYNILTEFGIPMKLVTYLLMELSPSGGAANSATTQEFPSILWNPKVHETS